MWRRTVLVFILLAIIDNTSAQNVNGTETPLCCPCPPGFTGDAATLAAPAPVVAAESARAGVDGVDDCPCRARDADSEGAASLFFPNAVRAFGNVVRPDTKEDSKPLLHPEVDLASSVLETLREATDEEYRDALERDAARAAATDVSSSGDVIGDGIPEEARNVVTIIVSPRDMDTDDAVPEASHVQETRCIHSPLGMPRASFTYRAAVPQKGIEDILNLPLPSGLLHRQRDSNLAASNVNENVVRPDDHLNKFLSRLRLRTDPKLLDLDPKKVGENIHNILNNANLSIKTERSGFDRDLTDNLNIGDEDISSEVVQENVDIDSNVESKFERESDHQGDLDSNTSPTNIQETVFENSAKNTGLLKSLLLSQNNGKVTQTSFPLKNLFKLRDVELVPLDILKNISKSKINVPVIKLDPLHNTMSRVPIKLPTQSGLNKLNKVTGEKKSANIQTIPRQKLVTTEILDTVPSPSDDNCVKLKPEADKAAGVDMGELEDSLLNSSTETDETDKDGSINSIAKQESDTDNIDILSAENMQFKNSELGKNDETDFTEDFKIIDDTQVPEQGSNSDVIIISQENIDNVSPSSIDLSEINDPEERSNAAQKIHNPLRTLDEIRKRVVDKLDALQQSNRNALDSIKHNLEEIPSEGDSLEKRNQDTDLGNSEDQISDVETTFESSSLDIPNEGELSDVSASAESVSFQDLQKMSDSILMASENQEQTPPAEDSNSIAEPQDVGSESEEISESEIDNVLGMDEAQMQSKEPKSNNDLNQNNSNNNLGNTEKALCPTDLLKESDQNTLKKSNGIVNENTENDLEPLASEPIMNILRPTSFTSEPIINILRPSSKILGEHLSDFETKLRQSIVQPSLLINADDFNLFRMPSLNIPDISRLNANIPTLEEIRTRVSEILGGLARTAGEDDNSSEQDSEDFASDVSPVIFTGGSSSKPISILPSLKPLEDINLDIIQLKPLPSLLGSSPQKINLPGLNLNRYKAKLAIPKSLELKPLNLASTLGNNGGLVGATLSIGPEKKDKTGLPNFKSSGNPDIIKSFRNALGNNPSISDITSSVHTNALNLLNVPKISKQASLQASNVMENFAENIKSHTEDTLRSIPESINPPSFDDIHNNLLKNANDLLSSGRSNLEKTLQASTPINSVVNNLRSQTENTIKQLHNTLHSPRVPDLNTVIQKNTNYLKSSRGPIESAVDNIKAQSESAFRNIQHSLDSSSLADLGDSVRKTTQNILKSSPVIPQPRGILGSTMEAIPPIHEVAGKLRSQTENAVKNIHQTLNTPTLSDISTSIQKSAQRMLKSPITNTRPEILKSTLQPSMSYDTVVDNLKSQTQNTMRNIQNSLNPPTLSDISSTMQKHAQNLLNSPVALTGRDAFEQVLQASTPINLAPHAEQVAKDLQKTLKATLKNNPIKELPPLPHPNDVIQFISNHQEDVNDKLYAIHTDLTDRIETIHNEVTDPERLRSILSPPGNRHFELFAIPLPMGPRSAPIARKQTRPSLQSKQPSLGTQRKQPKKPTATSRFRSEKAKLGSMRASTGKESISPKSFRMPSASAPVPTHIDRPTLSLTPIKPFKGLQELQGIKKPVLPKYKPLTQSKVTVTFGPTTLAPTPQAPVSKANKVVATTVKPRVTNIKRFKPKAPVRQPTPWNGWGEARSALKRLGEPLTSPSQTASNIRAPLKSKSAKPITKPAKTGISRLSTVSPKSKTPSKPNFKTTPLTQSRSSNPSSQLLGPLTLETSKPRSPLLTKLSEALKVKQTDTRLSASRGSNREKMIPAASERFEKVVALEEPMKENLSYKCKMMCVKLDLSDEQ